MSARELVFGPFDLVVPDDPDTFIARFSLDPSIGQFAEFIAVVRNDLPGREPLTRITFSLNERDFFAQDLAPGEVAEIPVALEPFPAENFLEGTLSGTEGAAGVLRMVAIDPIGVPQGGSLRLATGRTGTVVTTLLNLTTGGPGRLGYQLVVRDRLGGVLVTSPVRRLLPGASDVVDLADVAALTGATEVEGSVSVVWVAQGGTRLVGHAVEAFTDDVRNGRLDPRAVAAGGPLPLEEAGVVLVPPSRAKRFLEPQAVARAVPQLV